MRSLGTSSKIASILHPAGLGSVIRLSEWDGGLAGGPPSLAANPCWESSMRLWNWEYLEEVLGAQPASLDQTTPQYVTITAAVAPAVRPHSLEPS